MTHVRVRAGESRHRMLRWTAAAALGAATALVVAGPAAAAPTDVDGGTLDWGFKASFRAYVGTGNGTPPISTTGGATINADGTFRFPATGGTFDADAGTGSVNYGGSVVFSYPAHFFQITIADPSIVIDGAQRSLVGDVSVVASGGGFENVNVEDAVLATLGAGSPTVDGGAVSWSGLPATLTAAGASAFAGFYTEGTALDPVSASATGAGGEDPGDPGDPGEPGSGSASQELSVEVPGGPLTLSVAGDAVALTGASIGGSATGPLNPATVSDLRGSNAGWNLVGQSEDFTGDGGTIGAANLGWAPSAAGAPGSGTVAAGAAATGLNTGRTLCKADAGASSGVFTCGADLTLGIPATTTPGSYTATLTLTLS